MRKTLQVAAVGLLAAAFAVGGQKHQNDAFMQGRRTKPNWQNKSAINS